MQKRSIISAAALILMLSLLSAACTMPDTRVSNRLSTSFQATDDPITLQWTMDEIDSVVVGEAHEFSVTATNHLGAPVERVLYIIEIRRNGKLIKPSDEALTVTDAEGQELGYNEEGRFWYYGPPGGFTFPDDVITTDFTAIIHRTGTYHVKIYARQLPEEEE